MTLKDVNGKIDVLSKSMHDAMTEAGPDMDFTKVKGLGDGDTQSKVDKFRTMDKELNVLTKEREALDEVKAAGDRAIKLRSPQNRPIQPALISGEGDVSKATYKSVGQQVIEHERFKAIAGRPTKAFSIELPDVEVKTLFSTTAGFAPETTRTGRIVDAVQRPVQVLDLIPQTETQQASVVYMRETITTTAAAEVAEAAAYAEADISYAEDSSTVRKVGVSLPVTDEQLEDVPRVRGLIDNRLLFFLQQRIDSQVLNGNGTAPNLRGILNVSGIQTQAKGTDPVPDAVYKAITKVRLTGRARPTAIVMHPNDWQDVRLLRTADGIYIFGNPSDSSPERMWGLQVAVADAIAENTGLVGDFLMHCELAARRGADLQVGYINDDFTKGKQTMRADVRVAFVTYRATAFCTVTGI